MRARNQVEMEPVDTSALWKIQKEQLQNMAGSYQEFARSLSFLPEDEEENDSSDRLSRLQKLAINEHRKILAWQLKAFAECFSKIASESAEIVFLEGRVWEQAEQSLKEYGVLLRNGYTMQTKHGIRYYFELKTTRKCHITLQDVTGMLSVALGKNLETAFREQFYEDMMYHTYEMEEKSRFHMLSGFARAVKEGETISGDNGSVYERKDHMTYLLLADGVGSGQSASKESNAALEMIESILQSGNDLKEALRLAGSAFCLIETELHYPSFDGCEISLETGDCTIYKAGGVSSFLKNGCDVDIIDGGGTPLGAFPDGRLKECRLKLEDDSFVILVSDGVLENMNVENPEQILAHFIQVMQLSNPGEIASQILQFAILQSGGKVRDDMMVCVAGIWEDMIE